MAGETTRDGTPEPPQDEASPSRPARQAPSVPRPPTPEEIDEISRDQALITDEWGGEGPPAASPGRQR